MTWDRLYDPYLLKFRLNLHQKSHGIPSGADLSEFFQDLSVPITKKNVLSEACQFYNPTGLANVLHSFTVQQDLQKSSMLCQLHTFWEKNNRFCCAVNEILLK